MEPIGSTKQTGFMQQKETEPCITSYQERFLGEAFIKEAFTSLDDGKDEDAINYLQEARKRLPNDPFVPFCINVLNQTCALEHGQEVKCSINSTAGETELIHQQKGFRSRKPKSKHEEDREHAGVTEHIDEPILHHTPAAKHHTPAVKHQSDMREDTSKNQKGDECNSSSWDEEEFEQLFMKIFTDERAKDDSNWESIYNMLHDDIFDKSRSSNTDQMHRHKFTTTGLYENYHRNVSDDSWLAKASNEHPNDEGLFDREPTPYSYSFATSGESWLREEVKLPRSDASNRSDVRQKHQQTASCNECEDNRCQTSTREKQTEPKLKSRRNNAKQTNFKTEKNNCNYERWQDNLGANNGKEKSSIPQTEHKVGSHYDPSMKGERRFCNTHKTAHKRDKGREGSNIYTKTYTEDRKHRKKKHPGEMHNQDKFPMFRENNCYECNENINKEFLKNNDICMNSLKRRWKEIFMRTIKSFLYFVLLILIIILWTVMLILKYSYRILKYLVWHLLSSCKAVAGLLINYILSAKNRTQRSTSTSWKDTSGSMLPTTEQEAVAYLIKLKDSDPYRILNVDNNTTSEEMKRRYRRLAVLVHPDKCRLKNANEAFVVLKNAFETLTDPTSAQRRTSETEPHESEAISKLFCEQCYKTHPAKPTQRSRSKARYCAACAEYHSAVEGDVWLEGYFGYAFTCYLCCGGKVLEVTDWGRCQGLLDLSPNTHSVVFSFSFGPAAAKPGWSRRNQSYSSWDDWMEFRARTFGAANSGEPSTGWKQKKKKKARKQKHK